MSARRRAEEFAAAVDGRTPSPQLTPELRELLDLVGTLRTQEAPAPRPEFTASLREQLLAEAETALVPGSPLALPHRRRGARERRLTAAAAVFTLVGGSAGMAVAAQSALPGEALYPIKRGIEDAQLSLESEPGGKGRAYLEQAEDRLDEAGRLLEEDAPSPQVAETVDTFVVQSVAGAELLLSSFEEKRAPQDVELLRSFAADSLDRLQTLAESAPAEIQDELARAAVVLQRIDQQAAIACAECSDLPTLEMPVLMAQAAELSRAMEAVRTRSLNNDHPTIAVTLPRPARQPSGDGEQPQLPTGGTADETPRLGVGGPGELPRSLPRDPDQALKQLDDATGGLLGQVGSTAEQTAKDLQEGLEETVDETLKDTGLSQ